MLLLLFVHHCINLVVFILVRVTSPNTLLLITFPRLYTPVPSVLCSVFYVGPNRFWEVVSASPIVSYHMGTTVDLLWCTLHWLLSLCMYSTMVFTLGSSDIRSINSLFCLSGINIYDIVTTFPWYMVLYIYIFLPCNIFQDYIRKSNLFSVSF